MAFSSNHPSEPLPPDFGRRFSHELTIPTAEFVRRKLFASRIAALFLLIPVVPVIGLLIILVRLSSRGPGIYRQVRVGYGGREFIIFKIRTMRQDAEATSGPVWATEHDPRTTRLGSLLRRTHLDELPQLFNVLRGEMCLIGPRPERPEIVNQLSDRVPGYLDRLAVPPGIAGLAQVVQGGDVDLQSVKRKQSFDIAYILNLSTVRWLDLRILFATGFLLIGTGRVGALKLCGLDAVRPIALEEPTVMPLDRAA